MAPHGSPSDKIPDGIFLQAGLAVFALCAVEQYAHKQKHRSAFLALSQAKQFACSRVATSFAGQTMWLNQSTERWQICRTQGTKKPRFRVAFQMAPRVGLEPTTYRLTAGRSTIELSGKNLFFKLLILAT